MVSMAEHKRKQRGVWARTVFLCVLSAVIGSAATVYVLKADAPALSKRAIPYSRPVQSAETRGSSKLIVVDGDTVKSPFGIKYRLVGFDTPETWHPKCSRELELGQEATERLKELINSGTARIIEEGKTDKYGRTLAKLTVNGQDVGPILIGEGLAHPYDGGKRQSWCGL